MDLRAPEGGGDVWLNSTKTCQWVDLWGEGGGEMGTSKNTIQKKADNCKTDKKSE